MPSWWVKSSSKDADKKSEKGSLINTIHKKFTIVLEKKRNDGSGSSGKQHCDAKHASRSPISHSTQVSRCGGFAQRPQALPLPLPGLQQTTKHRDDSGNKEAAKDEASKGSKPFMFLPLPKPPNGPDPVDAEAVERTAYVSSDKCTDNDTPSDSHLPSPQASGYKNGKKAAMKSPSSVIKKNRSPNSGQNLVGGDFAGQFFWEYSRCSHDCSPIRSPRMTSPGPSSRIHSGAVTPLHPRAGRAIELPSQWPDAEHQRHRLPLPPINIFSTYSSNLTETTPVPRSPSRAENPSSHGPRWKKGKLLGRGTYGQVYVGFDSENGGMCAMKEVTLFSDDAKSQESAQQLKQEIALLSHLRHPNIVQYFGSEIVDDKLYMYLEYVSGGSVYKLLQDFGQLGEAAIQSYTLQILSGLAYMHARGTIHRDIKGANLLVDPNGRVKLADFGMAKHISGQTGPLSFKGSPYWMAPEIIVKSTDSSNLAVDIWSLGCTVLEMATTKPPWGQLEGAAAIFKIGHTQELPELPPYLSDDGKDFISLCLQRNPSYRPSAARLLKHPFVRNVVLPERPLPCLEPTEIASAEGYGNALPLPLSLPPFFSLTDTQTHNISTQSDLYVPWNVPSPILQNTSSRQSASPISSPRDISGSSTPLTGGGAISVNISKQPPIYSREGKGITPRSPKIFNSQNTMSFKELKPDLFLGPSKAYHIYQDTVQSKKDLSWGGM
ncbi:Mitogen-activated protein kinase kinase kinase YODA [Heracleum sosnowskyi]|uniref:mitogen-activated protein kinase kinase kinase n=1 Tax=Heracleum sosnowskyi TaxID=360622 RepID=A0AAD8MI72_9APIA|nr:Mitogen-activated protein kinase kinase kinase YODA [Heracleum sosnowskyi]